MAKMGRPKITPANKFPKDWKKEVARRYAEGQADVEIRVYLDISHETWSRLLKEDKEFSESIKKGRESSYAWWVKEARTSLRDKDFNSTLWYMNMKNRFGWADKQQHEVEGSVTIKLTSYQDE